MVTKLKNKSAPHTRIAKQSSFGADIGALRLVRPGSAEKPRLASKLAGRGIFCASRGAVLFNVCGCNYIDACAGHIFHQDIADLDRRFGLRMVNDMHHVEDFCLRNVRCGLAGHPVFLLSAGHKDGGGDDSRRVGDFFSGVNVSAHTGVAGYAHDFALIHLYCHLAAHGAADADQFSFLHSASLLKPAQS